MDFIRGFVQKKNKAALHQKFKKLIACLNVFLRYHELWPSIFKLIPIYISIDRQKNEIEAKKMFAFNFNGFLVGLAYILVSMNESI